MMMFCPPGGRNRRRGFFRKQNKMQKRAMQEAKEAGWNDGADQSSDDDEDLNNEHNLWGSVDDYDEDDEYLRKQSVLQTVHEQPALAPEDKEVNTSIRSFGSVPVFSPEYFEQDDDDDDQDTEHPTPQLLTSGSSDDALLDMSETDIDEDDDLDDSALVNKEELHALLDDLQKENHTETTTDPAETESHSHWEGRITKAVDSMDEEDPQPFSMPTPETPPNRHRTIQPSTSSDQDSFKGAQQSEDDHSSSDDDSLDLQVQTSVWKDAGSFNQLMSPSFMSPLSMGSASRTNIRPIPEHRQANHQHLHEEQDEQHSLDDHSDEDERQTGNDVFMLTEGVRYSGTGNQTPTTPKSSFFNFGRRKNNTSKKPSAALAKELQQSKNAESAPIHFQPRVYASDDEEEDAQSMYSARSGTKSLDPRFMPNNSFRYSSARSVASVKSTNSVGSYSSLASMITPIDLSLFSDVPPGDDDDEFEDARSCTSGSVFSEGVLSVSSCPVQNGFLRSDKYTLAGTRSRSRLSSSFKSSTKNGRVAYSLKKGKRHMSRSSRILSKSFLPHNYGLDTSPPHSTRNNTRRAKMNNRTLSILLVEIQRKIFEVVSIDIQQDTTVGDVLAKARSNATDPVLSEQKYISLCYGEQDFGAPMLPINLVIDWSESQSRPLAVAVPEGSSAHEMQSVKRVLWKNPKTRRWWEQENPFVPKAKIEEESAEAVVAESLAVGKAPDASLDSSGAGVEAPLARIVL